MDFRWDDKSLCLHTKLSEMEKENKFTFLDVSFTEIPTH